MAGQHRIVVLGQLADEAMAMLDARKDVAYELVTATDEATLADRVRGADAITIRTARLTPAIIDAAPNLRVISRHGVGYDNIPVDHCTARGIAVTIVGTVNAVAVAEHTMFLILAAAKRAIAFDQAIRRGDYAAARSGRLGVEIQGKTLLLIGLGRIGREVAKRAAAFDLSVMAFDPYAHAEDSGEVAFVGSLAEGLAAADIVSLHVPLTDATRNLIGAAELAQMKPGAILINASRGGLVDEDALAASVAAGHLFAAGLDTFLEEPLAASSPLIGLEDVLLSPHTAGLAAETLVAMGRVTVQNALDGLDGRIDPALAVNPEVLGA